MNPTQLVWLRNDLRLDDNSALAQAARHGPIHVVFVATPAQWRSHDESPARLALRAAALNDLGQRLATLGIPLSLLECDHFADIPETLARFCARLDLTDLWFNAETPLDERRRDAAVSGRLAADNRTVHELAVDLIVAAPVLTRQGEPFKVFTPYYRRWLSLLEQCRLAPFPGPGQQGDRRDFTPFTPSWATAYRDDLWPGSEQAARERLAQFCETGLRAYAAKRDLPAVAGTSLLSPYLANGLIGPRRLLATLESHCVQQGLFWQESDWLRELAWRDFYRQLLLYFPDLSMNRPFRPETARVHWREDDAGFQAWCTGHTGFPIVDAAMRQLLQTGWMHNRMRMIAAAFLCKLLLIDWRKGERFFMRHLVDGEFAANNGGWQWSASTGCDAAPYFRVFNPTRQSEKFDADGSYIRRFVPELASIDGKIIHDPPDALRLELGYPLPVVDYRQARLRAIAAFADLRR